MLRIGLQKAYHNLTERNGQSVAGSVQKRLNTVHRKGYDAL